MALTDKPYLPLYVRDWLTSNKLSLCSAGAHGVLVNVLCIAHRENDYGKILLKQKFKQTPDQIKNFARQLAKMSSLDQAEIESGLRELVEEHVLTLEGDILINERMVKDAQLSETRANVGREGGLKTGEKKKSFAKPFAKAKKLPNTDIDNDNEIKNKIIRTPLDIAFDEFLVMRKASRKPATPRAIELIKTKLVKLSDGDEQAAIAILNQSTVNNWQDIYPLKPETNGKPTPNNNAKLQSNNLLDLAQRANDAQTAIANKVE